MGLSHADASLDTGQAKTTLRSLQAAGRAAPIALAVIAVLLQVVYPLVTPGPARDRLTIVIVVVFAAAALTHALAWRGPRFAAALFVTTTLGGLAIEVIGVSTGLPFGHYQYLNSLGTQLFGVPVVVALAWTMMAYPAYVVSEVIGGGALRRAAVGGWALAAWDLFLDPQMVQAGHWQWETARWELVGIPVSNYVAWFLVATVMMFALRALAPSQAPGQSHAQAHTQAPGQSHAPPNSHLLPVDDRVPLALYAWTFASSVLAHAVFFGLPWSAVTGGIGMGVVILALARALTHPRP